MGKAVTMSYVIKGIGLKPKNEKLKNLHGHVQEEVVSF